MEEQNWSKYLGLRKELQEARAPLLYPFQEAWVRTLPDPRLERKSKDEEGRMEEYLACCIVS